MSDRRPAKPQDPESNGKTEDAANPSMRMESDPLELIEQCLASFPDSDPRQKILYKLRHAVILGQAAQQTAGGRIQESRRRDREAHGAGQSGRYPA